MAQRGSSRRGGRRSGGAALWLALGAGLAGCWGGGEPGKGEVREPRETATLRLDAAWGSLIVAPAARLPGAVAAALDSEEARALAHTDDGQRVDVKVRRLRAEAGSAPALPPTGRRGWVESVGVWSTGEAGAGIAGGAAVTGEDGAVEASFAVITMPPGTMGQGVWIGEHRLDVNWLPSSRTVMDRLSRLNWSSPLTAEAAASPVVRACLEAERASPFRRWRARMATGTLSPSEGLGGGLGGGPGASEAGAAVDAFADPALELIAAQTEERWAVALSRLGEVDAGLFDRVRRALVRTGRIGSVTAPTWPTDQAAMDQLLTALLTPRATPGMVREAAERLLEGLPASVAWLADDAAGVDAATLTPVVVVGAANLSEGPQAASVRWAGAASALTPPELTPLGPGATARLTAPAIPADVAGAMGPSRGLERLSVRVGDWVGTLRAAPGSAAVQPPGLLMDPMAADWTLAAWANGASGAAARAPVAVTLLRTPSPNPRERGVGEGWVIYGQAGAGVTGTLRIWLGPASRSRTAIVVDLSAAGEKVEGAKAEGAKEEPAGVRTFSAAIPGDAASAASGWRLLIGLDADVAWKDAGGAEHTEHMAWPRPMFPWETAPSRAALDLSAWGGVSAAPPAVIK